SAARDRRLRPHPAPRRGLGAQLPPPRGRPPRVVRPRAAGALLAALQLGGARAAVLGDGRLAGRARAPPRRAQLAALLRSAAVRARPAAVHRARAAAGDRAAARLAGLGALAGLPRPGALRAA